MKPHSVRTTRTTIRRNCRLALSFCTCLVLLCLFAAPLPAEQFGLFTYSVVGDSVRIDHYPQNEVGDVVIPTEIDGKPVTEIGYSAFIGCSGLTSVSIPESVTSIGHGAFADCSALTSVTIPEGVTRIGEGTFYSCRALTEIDVPEGVTSIGESAFFGCSRLARISLPSSLASISHESSLKYAFEGCHELAAIDIAPGNPTFSSHDGVILNAGKSELIYCPLGREGAYSIPNFVSKIGVESFDGCHRLASILLPSSISEIVGQVTNSPDHSPESFTNPPFLGCTSLQAIEVDPDNTEFSSRDGVLFDVAMTTLIRCPEGKAGHYSIPDGVRYFGRDIEVPRGSSRELAFENCQHLESITFPQSIDGLWSKHFQGCSRLAELIFLGDAPGFSSRDDWSVHGFTIFSFSSSTGFTTPTWKSYPSISIDQAAYPAATWLLEHGMSHDTDLHQDLNGDGVNLLLAYALNLDPGKKLRSGLPSPRSDGSSLSIDFYAASPGISYRVETSSDLRTWTSDGVILSGPDSDHQRRASVKIDRRNQFMRLVVSEDR